MGQETLDLARIHEIALISLMLPSCSTTMSHGMLGRAGLFFAQAIIPIEQTHRGAREANVRSSLVVKALHERSLELAESVEELKQEIKQRQAVEQCHQQSQQMTYKRLAVSRQMQKELRDLSKQLLTSQEKDRRKISRELRDVITQTLVGMNVRLAALKVESMASPHELCKKIEVTQRLIEKSIEIVHGFARELRSSVLDDLGLIPALEAYIKTYTKETGVPVSFKAFADIERCGSDCRAVLYRIVQEALTNVARHAKASRAEVSIQNHNGIIRMEIVDDGQGFEVAGTSSANKTRRFGLLGMRERVEMIGGTFCIESLLGKSTTVGVSIPAFNREDIRQPDQNLSLT
jgi:signal transduction histidine kinase